MDGASGGWADQPDGLVTVEWGGNTVCLAFAFEHGLNAINLAIMVVDPELRDAIAELLTATAEGLHNEGWQAVLPFSPDAGT